jgi:hypothetical protein
MAQPADIPQVPCGPTQPHAWGHMTPRGLQHSLPATGRQQAAQLQAQLMEALLMNTAGAACAEQVLSRTALAGRTSHALPGSAGGMHKGASRPTDTRLCTAHHQRGSLPHSHAHLIIITR